MYRVSCYVTVRPSEPLDLSDSSVIFCIQYYCPTFTATKASKVADLACNVAALMVRFLSPWTCEGVYFATVVYSYSALVLC